MTQPPDNHGPLLRSIRTHKARQDRSRREEGTLLSSLVKVGSFGWMIVVPTLGGLGIGHLVDEALGTRMVGTITLMLIGLGIGCRLVWQRINT